MAKTKDFNSLIALTQTTQALLTHFQSSLAPSTTASSGSQDSTSTLPNPIAVVHSATTLLKSHTTTLSLLLINPPLTPSALIAKIGDVSSGALSGMVAAASYTPAAGQRDDVGNMMRMELRSQVRRLLGTWGDILALVLRMAETRQALQGKDTGPTEGEKQDVLSATGVLWEACDTLLKLCNDGIVGLVVRKAQELRLVLLDAAEELKEWGEDVADEDEDDDEAEGSDADEDDMFGAVNKLGKDDTALKEVLDISVKKVQLVGVLYQAVIKRRLKTYPAANTTTNGASEQTKSPAEKLDELMALLKSIPETVDDLVSAFYGLDKAEAKCMLDKVYEEAKTAAMIARQSWAGSDDAFTAWSDKWTAALDAP